MAATNRFPKPATARLIAGKYIYWNGLTRFFGIVARQFLPCPHSSHNEYGTPCGPITLSSVHDATLLV
jgi:hypothetical protein